MGYIVVHPARKAQALRDWFRRLARFVRAQL